MLDDQTDELQCCIRFVNVFYLSVFKNSKLCDLTRPTRNMLLAHNEIIAVSLFSRDKTLRDTKWIQEQRDENNRKRFLRISSTFAFIWTCQSLNGKHGTGWLSLRISSRRKRREINAFPAKTNRGRCVGGFDQVLRVWVSDSVIPLPSFAKSARGQLFN